MVGATRAVGVLEALGIEGSAGLVAIVGGGGKSSLMFALAESLPGRVVMTTTTRIFASQMDRAEAVGRLDDESWEDQLDAFESSLLLVGRVEGDHALGVPREFPAQVLARSGVDWVVVEADGSRMLPVKAPAAHEPVVPDETDTLVVSAGIDALSGPIRDVAHRPELVSRLAGLADGQALTPEALAAVLTSREGGLKSVPERARAALLLNKVETPSQRDAAGRVARAALRQPRVERVAIGALKAGHSADWEVWSR
jgi:molybdenum cofactor cytidylyltransferase